MNEYEVELELVVALIKKTNFKSLQKIDPDSLII